MDLTGSRSGANPSQSVPPRTKTERKGTFDVLFFHFDPKLRHLRLALIGPAIAAVVLATCVASTLFAPSAKGAELQNPADKYVPGCSSPSEVRGERSASDLNLLPQNRGALSIVIVKFPVSDPPFFYSPNKEYEGKTVKFILRGEHFHIKAHKATILVYADTSACRHNVPIFLARNNPSYIATTVQDLKRRHLGY